MLQETIRVAMIIQAYHPRVGGAERQLAALAPLLQAQGVEVHVLTRRYPGLAAFDTVDDVPVYRLPIPGSKITSSLTFTLTALLVLRRLRPDVIHAHELLSPTTTAVAAKRLGATPVVVKVLGGGALGDLAKLKHSLLGARRVNAFRQKVDAFITISQEIDAELAQVGIPAEKRVFIPNGVDTTRFKPTSPPAQPALRRALGLADVPTVIFTGRLAREKRLDQLVSVWPMVRASQPDARLLVLGSGPEEHVLRQQAGAGVQFIGQVEDVLPFLQAADLFILPSSREGLSNALLEAMATGLPVIATAVGGAPDVIIHQHSGWLVPPGEPDALAKALKTLLRDRVLRTKLGQNGRQRILCDYALIRTAERLRQLYDRVINYPSHSLDRFQFEARAE